MYEPFQDKGRYHIETSPLICSANQWTGFYMITASILKGLKGFDGAACARIRITYSRQGLTIAW